MKVRIEDQQIIFRLSEEERLQFMQDRRMEVSLNLGKKALTFAIVLDAKKKAMDFKYKKNTFSVLIPDYYMEKWTKLKVGFEEVIELPNEEELELIVEKDLRRSKKV